MIGPDPGSTRAERLQWHHVESRVDAELLHELDSFDFPEVVRTALIAIETRPRCERIGDGALVNLRGATEASAANPEELVSIRLWIKGNHVYSVSRYPLAATAQVRRAWEAGSLMDSGDLVTSFARAITVDLDPVVGEMGDALDACESELAGGSIYDLRRRIATIRSMAISFRRFVSPDRNALLALADLDFDWLAQDDRLHIREAADRFARMAEELESIRERSALLHEQLTDMRTELIDRRSLMIAAVAFVFLPLTFITGLLGMNVEGIPFADAPWAFWGVVGFCAIVGFAVLVWFFARRWLGN